MNHDKRKRVLTEHASSTRCNQPKARAIFIRKPVPTVRDHPLEGRRGITRTATDGNSRAIHAKCTSSALA